MAYPDIYGLFVDTSNDLHKKIAVAVAVAAKNVRAENPATANHAERLQWANQLTANPDMLPGEAHRIILRVLETQSVLTGGNTALDTDVQTAVNALVDFLSGAE